jgi:ribosome biogenesis protein SSF1/2
MNGFTGQERQIQLMSSMFQNMFPSINVTKVKLNSIRRCVLLNYDQVGVDLSLSYQIQRGY